MTTSVASGPDAEFWRWAYDFERWHNKKHPQIIREIREHGYPEHLNAFHRRDFVLNDIGVGRTQHKAMVKRGEFPPPIKITDSGHAIAWTGLQLLAFKLERFACQHIEEKRAPQPAAQAVSSAASDAHHAHR